MNYENFRDNNQEPKSIYIQNNFFFPKLAVWELISIFTVRRDLLYYNAIRRLYGTNLKPP